MFGNMPTGSASKCGSYKKALQQSFRHQLTSAIQDPGFKMYKFRKAITCLLGLKTRLLERGLTYNHDLVWEVLRAADVVLCRQRNLEGGHLAREKLECLRWKLQPFPGLYDEMCDIIDLFDEAVARRRRVLTVPVHAVEDIFLTPGGVLAYVTSHP